MRVLLATDGSEYSEHAAQFLTRLNFSKDDEIIILHVLSEIPYEDDYHLKVRRMIKTIAPKIIQSTMDILKDVKAPVRTEAVEGYPDTSIIEVALKLQADIIVMGARGVRGLKLLVLGSSARSVAINSPIHTLVVKHFEREIHDSFKILFATDGSVYSDATAQTLTAMPFPENTEITVMNVLPSYISDLPERYAFQEESAERGIITDALPRELQESEKIVKKANDFFQTTFQKVYAMSKSGHPTIEILNAAEAIQADLIAVGSRGLRGIKGMLGSVSRNILAYSHCSVLIGKKADD